MNVFKHQFFDFLRLVGLRDRLRCPNCKAVGTWKPHGGWLDKLVDWRDDVANEVTAFGAVYATDRRWLCKYCGYNVYAGGVEHCAPNGKTRVWDVYGPDSLPTPFSAVTQVLGKVWPWRG